MANQAPDFERLKSMIDDDVRRQKRRSRGLLELLGAGATAFVLLIGTQYGQQLLAPGVSSQRIEQFAIIDQSTTAVVPREDISVPVDLDRTAQAAGVEPTVARALAITLSDGRIVGRGAHYDVRLGPAARASLKEVGLDVPPSSADAEQREAAVIKGVGLLAAHLDSMEAAITALYVDIKAVETALDLAFGSNLPKPDKYASFSRYLPPPARKRSKGPVNYVMALSIGYDMRWPVAEGARVSSGFGPRTHPVLGEPMWHTGTDLAVPVGTDIRAAADGRVVYSTRDVVNGLYVKVDHGYGLTSAYVHASELKVNSGVWVKKGDLIALSGQTGRATGPHLHFQVEINNRPVDPEAFRERKAPRAHRVV